MLKQICPVAVALSFPCNMEDADDNFHVDEAIIDVVSKSPLESPSDNLLVTSQGTGPRSGAFAAVVDVIFGEPPPHKSSIC